MRARFRTVNGACVGSLSFPTQVGALNVSAVGDDRADALAKAALIAERIVNDPVMRALMPPQAAAAIKAAKGLAAAAKRGTRTLRGFWRRLRGPGKRRLAAVLHKEAAEHEQRAEQEEHPATGDIGWNPFRRKRKKKSRRVPPRSRRMPPPEEPEEEPELPEEEQPEQPESADVGDDDMGDMGDMGDDDMGDDVNGGES